MPGEGGYLSPFGHTCVLGSGIHKEIPNRFPMKNVGNDEEDTFRFPPSRLRVEALQRLDTRPSFTGMTNLQNASLTKELVVTTTSFSNYSSCPQWRAFRKPFITVSQNMNPQYLGNPRYTSTESLRIGNPLRGLHSNFRTDS